MPEGVVGDRIWDARLPFDTLEVAEMIIGERAAEDECAELLFEDEGFETRDLEETLCGLSSDGVFESDGVDCNKKDFRVLLFIFNPGQVH